MSFLVGPISDLINGAANRAHESAMMAKQQQMQSQALDAQMTMQKNQLDVDKEKNKRDGDRDDKVADQQIASSKAQDDLANKVVDNDERQAQFERDTQQKQIDRTYASQDKAQAKVDKVDERDDDNDFNIRSSFLDGAGKALVAATYKQYNIIIVTDQENDDWETPVKGELTSQLVDVQLSDGSMVNFEARIFA